MNGRAEVPRIACRLAAVVMYAAAMTGCVRTKQQVAIQPPMPGRPECPTHTLELPVFDSLDHGWSPRIVTDIPIAPSIDDVPEYHDCQRLVREHESRFGPLVGIFAAEGAETLFNKVDGRGRPRTPESLRAPKAVAQIFNFDEEPYAPLAIMREFSCLYLTRTDEGTWKAYMVWARSDDQRCKKPLQSPGPGQARELDVFPHNASEYSGPMAGEDIPPVARWDSDADGRHAIGIRCGEQWCTIVAKGSHPRPVAPVPAAGELTALMAAPAVAEQKARRVIEVKGWYDEQQLAITAPSESHGLAPAGPRARLFPHAQLGEWNDPDDFENWRPVAYATVIEGSAGIYEEKLNLGTNVTTYDLIHRDNGESPPPEIEPLTCPAGADGTWYMRLTRATIVKYGCVTQRPHPEAARLPGTVRWRWKVEDETMWVRCPGGCCTLER